MTKNHTDHGQDMTRHKSFTANGKWPWQGKSDVLWFHEHIWGFFFNKNISFKPHEMLWINEIFAIKVRNANKNHSPWRDGLLVTGRKGKLQEHNVLNAWESNISCRKEDKHIFLTGFCCKGWILPKIYKPVCTHSLQIFYNWPPFDRNMGQVTVGVEAYHL